MSSTDRVPWNSGPTPSRKVDIVRQSDFSGLPKQPQQVGALCLTGTTADEYDQACKRLIGLHGVLGKGQKVSSVATEDDSALGLGVLEELLVRSGDGEGLTKRLHIMTPVAQQVGHLGWDVVVEKKSHTPESAICSATSASIIVR